ncbi:MAG: CheR family methyltransferase, partial [Verrucomicrobiota bacterium]
MVKDDITGSPADGAGYSPLFVPVRVMDNHTFERFREVIYQKSGISIRDGKNAMVSARVSKRMRALRIDSYEGYLQFVLRDADDEEVQHMLDVISTNVTHFFREPAHFEFLKSEFRREARQGRTTFRYWSAACSTGEEP